VTSVGFALSFVIGIGAGLALDAAGFVKDPMFAAIVLVSTSLGAVPDAGLALRRPGFRLRGRRGAATTTIPPHA
jgi:hypothetical protein